MLGINWNFFLKESIFVDETEKILYNKNRI